MEPVAAGTGPIETQVEEGKTYRWCACGLSQKQPFCDGSHRGTGLTPVTFTATTTGSVWLCACKKTGDRPYCDGSHEGT
jgi:CDGSH-type Zn-finger protein